MSYGTPQTHFSKGIRNLQKNIFYYEKNKRTLDYNAIKEFSVRIKKKYFIFFNIYHIRVHLKLEFIKRYKNSKHSNEYIV